MISPAAFAPLLDDLIRDAGLKGVEVAAWYGVFAPAGTPAAVVQRLNQEINDALKLPDVRERLTTLGAEPSAMTPADFGQWLKAEIATMGKVVKDGKVTVE